MKINSEIIQSTHQ